MRHDDGGGDGDEERGRCGLCGKILQPYDSISVVEVGERCSRCFNKEMAARLGIDFDNTPIAPIVVTDVDGVRHRFEIRSMLVPTGHAMSAREVSKPNARGGYRFEILGDFETDAGDLFKLLRDRIRQGLSVRHVEKTEHGWQLTQAHRLSGVIEWDPETEGARPLLIVDGRTFTWDQIGRMLMTFEGFTLNAIKARLGVFDQKGLVSLLGQLYDASAANRRFLHSRLTPGSRAIEEYRRLVARAIYPDPFSKRRVSVRDAAAAIVEYRRSTGDAAGTVDLMLTFVEAGTEQAADLGYGDEAYFDALQIRLDGIAKEYDTLPADVRAKVRARLGRIQVRAQSVGWGFTEAVDEVLHALDARPARVRPGKVDRH